LSFIILNAMARRRIPSRHGSPCSDVIRIQVDDPTVKFIASALVAPAGPGPFPAIIYMSGCAGLRQLRSGNEQQVALKRSEFLDAA
jgi:hypothetical protein